MNLQKTEGKGGFSVRQESAQKSVQINPSRSISADAPSITPRSISSVVAAAGLPADRLSASIISFARFFALSLKPETLAAIRRQAFTQVLPASVKPAAEGTGRQEAAVKMQTSFSLAAAAAESKGTELSPRGLEAFVRAIDPGQQDIHDSKPQPSPNGEGSPADKQEEQSQNKNNNGQNTSQKEDSSAEMSANALKELALEALKSNPLLTILNGLPGKNGQRWIVLPFDFCEGGRQFRVSLRILLETGSIINTAGQKMVLDITESGDFERSWLFILEEIGKLSVYLSPELSHNKHSSFARELFKLTGISPEHISIKSRQEPFPFESGNAGVPLKELCAINKAV